MAYNDELLLTPEKIEILSEKYGPKIFLKAIEYLGESGPKIIKNVFLPSKTSLWVAQSQSTPSKGKAKEKSKGKEKEKSNYLLIPNIYCQCKAFLMNSIYGKKTFSPCKHLVAQKIAQSFKKYDEITYPDSEWNNKIYSLF